MATLIVLIGVSTVAQIAVLFFDIFSKSSSKISKKGKEGQKNSLSGSLFWLCCTRAFNLQMFQNRNVPNFSSNALVPQIDYLLLLCESLWRLLGEYQSYKNIYSYIIQNSNIFLNFRQLSAKSGKLVKCPRKLKKFKTV